MKVVKLDDQIENRTKILGSKKFFCHPCIAFGVLNMNSDFFFALLLPKNDSD